jgi:chaperonin GroEL (HSP60 family)
MVVKKGIDKTCEFLVSKLKEHAKPVKGRNDIKVRERGVKTGVAGAPTSWAAWSAESAGTTLQSQGCAFGSTWAKPALLASLFVV